MKGKGFVEKLYYRTSPGYLSGTDERDRSGCLTRGTGPSALITPKGIFKFHRETKEMYLDALFPGVTVEEVRADIPWDLRVADTVNRSRFQMMKRLNSCAASRLSVLSLILWPWS